MKRTVVGERSLIQKLLEGRPSHHFAASQRALPQLKLQKNDSLSGDLVELRRKSSIKKEPAKLSY